jgi:hypothetical protein
MTNMGINQVLYMIRIGWNIYEKCNYTVLRPMNSVLCELSRDTSCIPHVLARAVGHNKGISRYLKSERKMRGVTAQTMLAGAVIEQLLFSLHIATCPVCPYSLKHVPIS